MDKRTTRAILVLLDMGFLTLLVIIVFAMLNLTGLNLTDVIGTASAMVQQAFAFVN